MSFSFGNDFKITIFGESHGKCVGVVIEGCSPEKTIDKTLIQQRLDMRRPGQSEVTTQRKEKDEIEILSGIFKGKTTGAPLVMKIRNEDVDSGYYDEIKRTPRPGHADLTAHLKYNGANDYRGGGTFSGRMTAALVIAGAVAEQILAERGVKTVAHIIQIGTISVKREISSSEIEKNVYTNSVRCADPDTAEAMEKEIHRSRESGDSIGGMIECRVLGVPAGIGEPFFDSVESVLSHLIFAIPGVKGIEFGAGFLAVEMMGSEHNDNFELKNGRISTETNNAGGILGGISNGMPIILKVAMKPTPSISRRQKTIDLEKMEETEIGMKGRHDPCIAVRAVPVVEAAASIALTDLFLRNAHEHI
ncbi:MAG: chorismate synthase [Euryarchaeota archaeon]|nr:chorismate synthase [Euryarchaeota archaeon]